MDYYLKAADATALYNALEAAGIVREIPQEERTSEHEFQTQQLTLFVS